MSVKGFKKYDEHGNCIGIEKYDYNSLEDIPDFDRKFNNLSVEIASERARINAISSLKEGSTTGDAELMEARIGADGETYDSLGIAIREQFKGKIPMFFVGKTIETRGEEVSLVVGEDVQAGQVLSFQYYKAVGCRYHTLGVIIEHEDGSITFEGAYQYNIRGINCEQGLMSTNTLIVEENMGAIVFTGDVISIKIPATILEVGNKITEDDYMIFAQKGGKAKSILVRDLKKIIGANVSDEKLAEIFSTWLEENGVESVSSVEWDNVLNRPFYSEIIDKIVWLRDIEVSFFESGTSYNSNPFGFILPNMDVTFYQVVFDGEYYSLILKEEETYFYLGNRTLIPDVEEEVDITGEPFVIVAPKISDTFEPMQTMYTRISGITHLISTIGWVEKIVKIPEKYLPSIPRKTSELTNDSRFQSGEQVATLINQAISEQTHWRFEKVNTLPETGVENTIYLVPNSESGNNIYDEYIWITSESAFEVIGSTTIDLSNYYQKKETYSQTEIDALVKASENSIIALVEQLSNKIVNYLPKNQGSANVGKILVVGTDGNLTLTDMPEGGVSGDVVGVLDESNNILLSGNLANGTYTLKYENENGTVTEIGNLVVSSITDYAIITTLENCTSSGATSVRVNGSATVTITANSGYALPDSITVSGATYTWDKSTGNIVLSNPTSDVYITVTATKAITNFIEYNADNTADWNIWCNNARVGSDGTYRLSTTQDVTNYIAVQKGDIIHWHDMMIYSQAIGFYKSDKTFIASLPTTNAVDVAYIADCTTLNAITYDGQFTIAKDNIAFIRFTILDYNGSDSDNYSKDAIVNIERNSEYL